MTMTSTSRRFRVSSLWAAAAVLALAPSSRADGPPAGVVGTFADERLTVELHAANGALAGTFTTGGQSYPATAKATGDGIAGTFDAHGTPYAFTASLAGDVLTLTSGGTTHALRRAAGHGHRDLIRYVRVAVQDDPTWIGGDAVSLLLPAGWKVKGAMVWRPETLLRVQPLVAASDPASAAAVGIYPTQTFTWGIRVNTPTYMGNEIAPPPRDAAEALSRYVFPRVRPELVGAKVVDRQDLPNLAAAPSEWIARPTGASAVRLRFEYDLHGTAVQEDLYARLLAGAQPRTGATVWLIDHVTSVRAAKGQLDAVSPVARTAAASVRVSPQWHNRLMQFVQAQTQIALGAIQQEGVRAAIRARMSDEISEARRQEYEAHSRAQDERNQATAETMRDQQPWTTTEGGKVELPFQYGIAWQGADGQYIATNDAGYDPNTNPDNRTTYTRLQKAPGPGGR
jgi:hypothetical protein